MGRPGPDPIRRPLTTPDPLMKGPDILQAALPEPRPIDRARLAERVFSDDQARKYLNRITHPEIAAESARLIAEAGARGVPRVIYEATLIVENGLYRGFPGVIVVDLPEEEQVRRAVQRGLSESQARLRIKAQASRQARLAVAHFVIDNSGTDEQTRAQVKGVWARIQAGERPPAGGAISIPCPGPGP